MCFHSFFMQSQIYRLKVLNEFLKSSAEIALQLFYIRSIICCGSGVVNTFSFNLDHTFLGVTRQIYKSIRELLVNRFVSCMRLSSILHQKRVFPAHKLVDIIKAFCKHWEKFLLLQCSPLGVTFSSTMCSQLFPWTPPKISGTVMSEYSREHECYQQ